MGGGVAFPMWALGVILVVVGSLGNNYGNNLVSLGHTLKKKATISMKCLDDPVESQALNKPDEETPEEKTSHARWRAFGVFVIVVANLSTFAAFGFAAQSLLAALESVQFLSNVAFAKAVHKESVTRRTIIATLIIVVGNIMVVIFADKKAVILNSADLIHIYRTNNAYHGYLVVAFVLFIVLHFTYVHYHKARVERGRMLWKHSFMEPFAYSVSAAIIGTQAVLNSKCMSMLIQSSARTDRNEFTLPTIWVILGTWILFVAYWLRRLDKGLELFPPQFIIPVLQVFFVFFAILCGGIYFSEFETFGLKQYIGFVTGVVLILVGVYLLAPVDSDVVPEGHPGTPGTYSADLNNVIVADSNGCDQKEGPTCIELAIMSPETQEGSMVGGHSPNMRKGYDVSGTENMSSANSNNNGAEEIALRFDLMDPAELAVKKKRAIVKRPTNPVVDGIDGANLTQ
jgi:hypothetical protein